MHDRRHLGYTPPYAHRLYGQSPALLTDLYQLTMAYGYRKARAAEREGVFHLLRRMELACDIDAIREGTVVFPHEPLVRVRGPILQAQIIETPC